MGFIDRRPGDPAELRACLVALDFETARELAGLLRVHLFAVERADLARGQAPTADTQRRRGKLRQLVELLDLADAPRQAGG